MKIEIARIDDRMAPSGKAILRSLQNDSLPIVDLVIRESFQNSLDATLSKQNETIIDVTTQKIKTTDIAHYFDKVSTRLKNLFPTESTMIAIRDSNTSGLTGEFNTTDKKKLNDSNIYKLIYGLNMNQDKVDAGGSWGLGKTSFFRMGSGIVVYYSRVKLKNSKYEERLAACLIEDSDKVDAIMPDNDRGIAWWGEKHSSDIHGKSIPITDQTFIATFLKDFNIKPYTGNETGTTIVVPFIKQSDVTIKGTSQEAFPWEADLEESIVQSIQRWYFPRIFNRHYQKFTKNSILKPSVNGKVITPNAFSETFEWFQELYSAATKVSGGHIQSGENYNIHTREITLASMGMSHRSIPVGYLAYVRLGMDDLKESKNSGFISPIKYIGDYANLDGNPYGANILAYLRKPGMVVEYVVNDMEWLQGLSVEENSYVLAIFVPNSDGELHKKYLGNYSTLESYLRDTENADHATWFDKITDTGRITIVNRIKKSVSKILSKELIDEQIQSNKRTSALSRHFGNMFLPMSNFGKSSSVKHEPNSTKKKTSNNIKRSLINVNDIDFVSDNVRSVNFDATIQSETISVLYFDVATSDKNLDQDAWIRTFGDSIPFPFKINKIILTKINDKEIRQVSEVSDANTARFEIPNKNKEKLMIEGVLEFEINDLSMTPNLSMKTENTTNKEEGEN